jgi:excisionase family DNA binding protein
VIDEQLKKLKLAVVADELSCSERTVRRLINDGELPAVRVRGSLRITREDLDGYIERQRVSVQKTETSTGFKSLVSGAIARAKQRRQSA